MNTTLLRILIILIVLLTLGTSFAHLLLGYREDDSRLFKVLYLLNGFGYLALLVPLFVRWPGFTRFRSLWHGLFIAYTAITIAAYLYTHSGMLWMGRLDVVNKANEVALIVVLFLHLIVGSAADTQKTISQQQSR